MEDVPRYHQSSPTVAEIVLVRAPHVSLHRTLTHYIPVRPSALRVSSRHYKAGLVSSSRDYPPRVSLGHV